MSFFLSPLAIPVCGIIGVFSWMCISAIVNSVQSIVKHRNEVELKQQLVDRGLSVDDIERIVRATNVKYDVEQHC
jgi:hypothetical protein